jgi:hypothetical protein
MTVIVYNILNISGVFMASIWIWDKDILWKLMTNLILALTNDTNTTGNIVSFPQDSLAPSVPHQTVDSDIIGAQQLYNILHIT